MFEFSVDYIAELLDGTVEGDGAVKISYLGKIQDAKPGDISFLSNPKYESSLYSTKASAVIIEKDFKPRKEVSAALIRVKDPYLGFTTLLEEFHKRVNLQKQGIENPSFIADSAKTGEGIYRGAFSYIGNNCEIGNNVKIFPHVYVGDNVRIGDDTVIYAGAKIYPGSVIGHHCVLHSGVVVGSDGFGFAPQENGTYKTIPQLGNVIIGNHVDIGANTVLDCATMGSTIIGNGVKLDNLIQIAHNVEVGDNTVIAAQTGVSGSTVIGKNCVVAGQVGIVGHLKIADKTMIGAQAGIGKSIEQEGSVLLGSPAFDRKQYLRTYAVFKKLPDLNERIRELEKKILNLSGS